MWRAFRESTRRPIEDGPDLKELTNVTAQEALPVKLALLITL